MKELNLLGIRQKAILSRTKNIGEDTFTVIRPLTAAQEKELDDTEKVIIDGKHISRKSIYIYGEVNLDSKEDIDTIAKFDLVSPDGGTIYSNFDYAKGCATFDEHVKFRLTYDVLDWFKYNYCLIGKPARIVIYECLKSSL